MPLCSARAPARPLGCAGALLFALVACGDRAPQQAQLVIGADTITLDPGVAIVDFAVGGRDGEFAPQEAAAHVGDVVRFTATDLGTHAIVFLEGGLSPDARAFLDNSGQLRGPPLLEPGSAWVLSLEGAPAGEYPFHCVTHGGAGRITVSSR